MRLEDKEIEYKNAVKLSKIGNFDVYKVEEHDHELTIQEYYDNYQQAKRRFDKITK